jgi:hypothetical protein
MPPARARGVQLEDARGGCAAAADDSRRRDRDLQEGAYDDAPLFFPVVVGP